MAEDMNVGRSRRRVALIAIAIIVVIVVVALLLARCGSGDGGGGASAGGGAESSVPSTASTAKDLKPVQVKIVFGTSDPSSMNPYGDGCEGSGPYKGLKRGATVVMRSPSGEQVASSTLSRGQFTGSMEFDECRFELTAPLSVPALDSYSLEIPGLPTRSLTAAQIAAAGGVVEINVGR